MSTAFVDDYLPALLAQASSLISTEFHAVVAREGMSISEWRVLATLADQPALTIGRVAQICVMKQPTVTRLLDRMAAKGQVERIAHESDRRMTLVRITEAGHALIGRLVALAREHEQRVLEPFGLEHAAQLKSMLRRMIDLHVPGGDAA